MPRFLRQADAVFLRMDGARTPMHVGCLLTFSLPPDATPDFLPRLLESLRTQELVPPFNCRLASVSRARLAPAWEECHDLELDYHVRHSALPRPGGERELGVLIARLHSHSLDMARPLWEIHLIEGLEGRRFAIYTKVHHSLMDGATGVRLLREWLTEDPHDARIDRPFFGEGRKPRADDDGERAPRAGGIKRVLEVATDQVSAAVELFRTVRDLSDPELHPAGGMYSAMRTPRTPFNVRVTAQRRLATQVYEFARFQALREATGASINDIVLAITGAAMRRYLMEYNALPDETMIASVPVALPRKDGARGNAVAGFVVPLATDHPDPLRRLERIQTVTQETKEALTQLSSASLDQFAMLGFLPMVLGQMSGLNARLPPLCNITVSNVAGPKQPLYLGGARLEAIFPVSLLFDGYAINLTLVSYAQKFCLGFVGCRNALPHLQRLAVYTGLALDELEAAVKGTAPKKRQKTRDRRRIPNPESRTPNP